MELVYRDVRELVADPRNTRTHAKDQIKVLKKTLLQFGWTNPLILHGDQIVAGHGRSMAFLELKKEGKDVLFTRGYKLPCIQRDDMTDEQRRAYVIADNRTAELAGWDQDLLKDELNQLIAIDKFEISSTGFDLSAVGEYKAGIKEFEEAPVDPSVLDLKSSLDVKFPREGKYDLPPLRKDMLLDLSKVKHIASWAGPGSELRGSKYWWYNFASDSQLELDWTKVILGFYVDDHRFDCWWDDPAKYCKQYLRRGIVGATSPNFTVDTTWTKAENIWQTYKSRFVGRYMQEAGLKIIPDIAGTEKDIEWICAGLKGFKTIALQAHQSYKTTLALKNKKAITQYIMDQLKPDTVVFYAPSDRLRLFPMVTKARVIHVEPRSKVRQRIKKATE